MNNSIPTPWQDPLTITPVERPSGLWPYLSEQGSLTQRLRAQYPDLYVQRLKEYDTSASTAEATLLQQEPRQCVLVREIYLRTESTICTYGRSVIPSAALQSNALPWLKQLGNNALGDIVSRHTVWQREHLQMCLLKPDHREYQQAMQAHTTQAARLWARRSVLMIEAYPILVTEVFFPEWIDDTPL